MADHFKVTPGDVTTHAATVDARAEGVSNAVDAAKSVVMDVGAFGVLCAPIALELNAVSVVGIAVGAHRANALKDVAKALRDSASEYEDRDKHHASAMDALTAAIDEHDAGGTPQASGAAAQVK